MFCFWPDLSFRSFEHRPTNSLTPRLMTSPHCGCGNAAEYYPPTGCSTGGICKVRRPPLRQPFAVTAVSLDAPAFFPWPAPSSIWRCNAHSAKINPGEFMVLFDDKDLEKVQVCARVKDGGRLGSVNVIVWGRKPDRVWHSIRSVMRSRDGKNGKRKVQTIKRGCGRGKKQVQVSCLC